MQLFPTKLEQKEQEKRQPEKAKKMEEIQTEQGKSFAAPLIFILVFAFHFLSKYIESSKNKVFFFFFFSSFWGFIDFAFQSREVT